MSNLHDQGTAIEDQEEFVGGGVRVPDEITLDFGYAEFDGVIEGRDEFGGVDGVNL